MTENNEFDEVMKENQREMEEKLNIISKFFFT